MLLLCTLLPLAGCVVLRRPADPAVDDSAGEPPPEIGLPAADGTPQDQGETEGDTSATEASEYDLLLADSAMLDRGGLAAIIALTYGWKPLPAGSSGSRARVIRDSGSHWAKLFIRLVVERRVMDLYQNHTFRPDDPVSRGDLADVCCRLLGGAAVAASGSEVAIPDLSPDHRLHHCVRHLVDLGLLERFPDDTVRINSAASGSEAQRLVSSIQHQGVVP